MNAPQLYVQPEHRVFAAADEGRLVKALDRLVRDTLAAEVGSLAELKLNPDGTLADGYRYTKPALRQVCTLACAGLYQAVVDLAGLEAGPGDPPEHDPPLAIRTFNRAVELRLGRFLGQQRLIRHVRLRRIEGLIGPRYAPLENADFFARAREVAAGKPRPAAFAGATLAGRRLTARFADADPLFEVPGPDGPDAYRGGLHLTNSEIGGESTVRAAVILRRDRDGTTSLGPFLGGRRTHTGKDFARMVAVVFAAATAAEQDPRKLRAGLLRLRAEPLGLGFDLDEDRQARVAALASRLLEHGVPKALGTRAVLDALYRGAEGPVGLPPRLLSRAELESRTAFDLYAALTGVGASGYAGPLESVEQSAYKLLTGALKLPS